MHDLPVKIEGDTELNVAGIALFVFTIFICLI